MCTDPNWTSWTYILINKNKHSYSRCVTPAHMQELDFWAHRCNHECFRGTIEKSSPTLESCWWSFLSTKLSLIFLFLQPVDLLSSCCCQLLCPSTFPMFNVHQSTPYSLTKYEYWFQIHTLGPTSSSQFLICPLTLLVIFLFVLVHACKWTCFFCDVKVTSFYFYVIQIILLRQSYSYSYLL